MVNLHKGKGVPPPAILLVEDNPDHAEIITRVLHKIDSRVAVYIASDGQQALEILGLQEGSSLKIPVPKLILLDIRLPKLGGPQVLKAIKSSRPLKNIPIIVLTTSTRDAEIKEMYRLGANSYIVKPGRFEDFLFQLKKLQAYLEDYSIKVKN